MTGGVQVIPQEPWPDSGIASDGGWEDMLFKDLIELPSSDWYWEILHVRCTLV